MFDTIILLTGLVEQPLFSALLIEHNPSLTIISVSSSAELTSLDFAILRRARLIAFTTPVIVPQSILAQLGYGAYNFHPGPPEYPGWAPAHFALCDGATEFGVTIHAMVAEVDAGPIILVEKFDITAKNNAVLEGRTYVRLTQLFNRLSKTLATQAEPLQETSIQWGRRKNTRRDYAATCGVPLDVSEVELHQRIEKGIAPTITLHGIEFRAVLPDLEQA